MPTLADVLRRHGAAYLERFGSAMPAEQKRVLRSIMACRTGQLGTVHYQCAGCGRRHVIGRCCGNRHCPSCQTGKGADWCRRQLARRLPCHYFLLTFTVPAAFRKFARRHPGVAYAAMFRASSAAIKTLAVGDGGSAVKYLAPYVFRVAISDKRIVSCDDRHVTFRYRRSGSRRMRTMRLEAAEFIRRFLQHVLPRGLQKVRHYGFLSANSQATVESLQWLVAATRGQLYWLVCFVEIVAPSPPKVVCCECGQPMTLIAFLPPTSGRLHANRPP